MPKASKITLDEMKQIATISARDVQAGPTQISSVVGRSKATISRLMSNEEFINFRNEEKKKIDQIRIQAIAKADRKILADIDQFSPRELVGLSKIYYEQTYGFQIPGEINGEKVAVVITQG